MRCMCCASRWGVATTSFRKRWLALRCRQVLPVQRQVWQVWQVSAWQRLAPVLPIWLQLAWPRA